MPIIRKEQQDPNQPLGLRNNDKGTLFLLGKIFSRNNLALRTQSVTATTILDHTAAIVLVDATAGNLTLTLPYANSWGRNRSPIIVIIRTDSSANVVTLQRNGTDEIVAPGAAAATSYILSSQTSYTLLSSESAGDWHIVSISASGSGGGTMYEVFTASGTFTWPTDVHKVWVTLQAGGGGGGGSTSARGGGGGGSGETVIRYQVLRMGQTTTAVTVGAAGAGVSGANGTNGGDSSFGSFVRAQGGAFGQVTQDGLLRGGAGGTGGTYVYIGGGGGIGCTDAGVSATDGGNATNEVAYGNSVDGAGGGGGGSGPANQRGRDGGRAPLQTSFIGGDDGASAAAGSGGGGGATIFASGKNGGSGSAGVSAGATEYGVGGGGAGGATFAGGNGGAGYVLIEW